MPTVAVSLVSLGYRESFGQQFQGWAMQRDWSIVDATALQRDPADVVRHDETGSSPNTQVCVCGQSGFVQLVKSTVAMVMSGKVRVAVACNQGKHRSDVVARFVEDILNCIPADASGIVPMYSAKYWAISQIGSRAAYERTLSDIVMWQEEFWQVPVTNGKKPYTERFGYTAAMQSRQSAMNWRELHEWVDSIIDYNLRGVVRSMGEASIDEEVVVEEAPPVYSRRPQIPPPPPKSAPPTGTLPTVARRPQPRPPLGPPPHIAVKQEEEATEHREAAGSAFAAPVSAATEVPSPVAEGEPAESTVGTAEAAAAPDQGTEAEQSVAEGGASTTSGRNKMKRRFSDIGVQTEESSFSPRYPKWVAFEQSPQQWAAVLMSLGVDDRAAQDIFLLAQMSEEGWHFANAILSKLIKKRSDGVAFDNISAFIHRCVNNARQEMSSAGTDRRPSYARASGASSSSSAGNQQAMRHRAERGAQQWGAEWTETSQGWSGSWGEGWGSSP